MTRTRSDFSAAMIVSVLLHGSALIAAIPAYIFYNGYSTAAGRFSGRLEGFADDLSTAIQRRLADRT